MGLGSGIRKKPIPDPGSRGQKGTGSRTRIRNTAVTLETLFATLDFFLCKIKEIFVILLAFCKPTCSGTGMH
jgi:hypothetical protein